MANPELNKKVKQDIENILKGVEMTDESKFEESRILLNRAKNALKRIPQFNQAIIDNFFTQKPSNISFSAGNVQFDIFYYNKQAPNQEEHLSIQVEKSEKLELRSVKFPNGKVRGDITYYDDAPNFVEGKYRGFRLNLEQAATIIAILEAHTE